MNILDGLLQTNYLKRRILQTNQASGKPVIDIGGMKFLETIRMLIMVIRNWIRCRNVFLSSQNKRLFYLKIVCLIAKHPICN